MGLRAEADLLIRNSSELIVGGAGPHGVRGEELGRLPLIANGAVAVRDGRIAGVGTTVEIDRAWRAGRTIDADGALVSAGLVDVHTHLVHGGSRHEEWEARVLERPVVERTSGIGATVDATRSTDVGRLRSRAIRDLEVALTHGTTTMESKSGYGLDRETEIRTLRLLGELDRAQPIDVVPTFLGAHVVPAEFQDDRDAYVHLVIDLLERASGLARYCDLTCDPVGFSSEECRAIARRAEELGMALRFHADQTGNRGGAALAIELGAASADHLECVTDDEIIALAASETVGVLLPGVTHHLLQATPTALPEQGDQRPPAMTPAKVRRMVDAGCRLALATDYNPGSCPTVSMQAVMQLAARIYRLGYAEVWQMATINAALALGLADDRGSIEPGKLADLVIWAVPEHGQVINRFGSNLAEVVIKAGEVVVDGRTPPGWTSR